jgi:hypothetical protein
MNGMEARENPEGAASTLIMLHGLPFLNCRAEQASGRPRPEVSQTPDALDIFGMTRVEPKA